MVFRAEARVWRRIGRHIAFERALGAQYIQPPREGVGRSAMVAGHVRHDRPPTCYTWIHIGSSAQRPS
jgi:hypothetical protein